jgi:cobalamin biosynthesis protein CobD/CbiB
LLGYRLWKQGQFFILLALICLVIFFQAHNMVRHPIMWVFLVIAMLSTQQLSKEYNEENMKFHC